MCLLVLPMTGVWIAIALVHTHIHTHARTRSVVYFRNGFFISLLIFRDSQSKGSDQSNPRFFGPLGSLQRPPSLGGGSGGREENWGGGGRGGKGRSGIEGPPNCCLKYFSSHLLVWRAGAPSPRPCPLIFDVVCGLLQVVAINRTVLSCVMIEWNIQQYSGTYVQQQYSGTLIGQLIQVPLVWWRSAGAMLYRNCHCGLLSFAVNSSSISYMYTHT